MKDKDKKTQLSQRTNIRTKKRDFHELRVRVKILNTPNETEEILPS